MTDKHICSEKENHKKALELAMQTINEFYHVLLPSQKQVVDFRRNEIKKTLEGL